MKNKCKQSNGSLGNKKTNNLIKAFSEIGNSNNVYHALLHLHSESLKEIIEMSQHILLTYCKENVQ